MVCAFLIARSVSAQVFASWPLVSKGSNPRNSKAQPKARAVESACGAPQLSRLGGERLNGETPLGLETGLGRSRADYSRINIAAFAAGNSHCRPLKAAEFDAALTLSVLALLNPPGLPSVR